jgi:hypothetical protein
MLKVVDSSVSRGLRLTNRATYKFVKSGWGKKRKRWLHLYLIYPPESSPFLPSDEALETLVATIPDIRFHGSERFSTGDHFYVYGRNRNLFTARADSREKSLRKEFLRDVEAMALESRDVPLHVMEASCNFLKICSFVSVEWDGTQAIGYDAQHKRFEGKRVTGGIFWRPFREFERMCKPILPFTYEAAPP